MMGPMRGMMTGPPRPIKKTTLPRIARSFLPYRREMALTAVAVLASATLGLLPPFLLKVIVNDGLLAKRLDIVSKLTAWTLAATLLGTAFALGYGYLSVVVGQRIMRDLRNELYDHVQGMSLRFFTGTRTGEIQSRLANDVGGVQSVVSDTAATVLSNVTIVLSTLVAMIYMDWRLTLLSVGILPLFAFIATRVGAMARGVRSRSQSKMADLTATMQETLSVSGILLTKVSGRRALSLTKFSGENEALTDLQIQQSMIMRYFFNLIGLTFSLTPALVYWLAGWLIVARGDQHLNLGTIVAFTALQSRLFFPLTGLLNVQVEVTSALALFDRIFEYLDLPQEIVDAPDAVALTPDEVRGDVAFHGVRFRYEPGQESPTLDDITLTARPGQLVALVGASGAGKTTLTYLIPRLYDVEAGCVTIDGVDVRQIRLDSLGSLVGVVTQETYLVHDTIRANLQYGRPDATEPELIAAARAAAIHDHIASLPEGYDTVVGERGYKLSGGEKQRIAIARAILKNPRILILDEATSALDTHSERLIQAALEPLMHGRTTFAIAHRLSTILSADLILVMSEGRIVERGTHDELVARDGVYARLYAVQFEDTDDGPDR
ncbi:MAG TPA: ABC transporter ATP-binding protein [Chthonomonadaceae bacterium]|nr:ABC transporter ATP-binding protein [Chthonomonadaceae bacterium]